MRFLSIWWSLFSVKVHDINIEPTPHQLRVSQSLAKLNVPAWYSDRPRCLSQSCIFKYKSRLFNSKNSTDNLKWKRSDRSSRYKNWSIPWWSLRIASFQEQLATEVWDPVLCRDQADHPGQHQPEQQHHHPQVQCWPHSSHAWLELINATSISCPWTSPSINFYFS